MIDLDAVFSSRETMQKVLIALKTKLKTLCDFLDKQPHCDQRRLSLASTYQQAIVQAVTAAEQLIAPVAGDEEARQIAYQHQLEQILSQLLNAGAWNESLFWKNIKDSLVALMSALRASTQTVAHHQKSVISKTVESSETELEPYECVFIHLYQATGKVISNWYGQIQNLRHLAQSRPIYSDKETILSVLEKRGNLSTDAYIAIKLPKKTVVQSFRGRMQVDKYGQELVVLDMDLWPNNPEIDHFYHEEHTHHWQGDRLVVFHEAKQ